MSIRLIALDLDGTLLRDDKTIAARDADAVRAAVKRGVRVVVCSARPPRGGRFVLERLGLCGPMVCYNGALIVDWREGLGGYAVLRHRPMSFAWAMRLVERARGWDEALRVDAEVMDRWVTDRPDPVGVTATAKLAPPDVIAPIDRWPDEPVTKLMFSGEAGVVAGLRGLFESDGSAGVSMVQTEPELLQVMAAGVDKGESLAWLCGRLGVEREEVMAVGDNENDVPMLRWAGLGVAMGHAGEAVRRHAGAVVADHHGHGVSEALALCASMGKTAKEPRTQ